MSEKLSSPSNSSASLKSPLSRLSGTSNDEAPHLIVVKQPPKHVYSNESFRVELKLVIPNGHTQPTSAIDIVASVHHANSGRECGAEALLITEPSRIQVGPDETSNRCIVLCRVRMDDIRRDKGAPLHIRFSSRAKGTLPSVNVASVNTDPVQIVNYKLKLSWEDDWESVWYKNEGSKDKSMEVFASMSDRNGVRRIGEQIPLRLTLCYQTEEETQIPVANQDILQVLGATRIAIDRDSGMTRIRYRVNDVSKNHQSYRFVILIETERGYKDVAPVHTPPVKVLSKRNKRPRTGSKQEAGQFASPSGPRPHAGGKESHDASADQRDKVRLVKALRSVVDCADEMARGLESIRWQVAGYEGYNNERPVYSNIANPNAFIDDMLQRHAITVTEGLRVMLREFEGHSDRDDPSPPFMPLPIPEGVAAVSAGAPPEDMHNPIPPPPARTNVMSMLAIASEPFRVPPRHDYPVYPGSQHTHTNPHVPPYYSDTVPTRAMHSSTTRRPLPPPMYHRPQSPRDHEESRECEVTFVLAKEYKGMNSGRRLGFPAYNANKEILGFYLMMGGSSRREFSPIWKHQQDFGPFEIGQATSILESEMLKRHGAVLTLREGGSIDRLLDQALVIQFREDMANDQAQQRAPV